MNNLTEKVNVLVTGADGFIGKKLCESLSSKGYLVRKGVRASRSPLNNNQTEKGNEKIILGNIEERNDWNDVFTDIDTIVHLAGRAHVLNEKSNNPLEEFHKVNVLGSIRLFEEAAAKGIKRFVFVSSIGVNGSATTLHPFTSHDAPHPHNAYAFTKLEAEKLLQKMSQETGVELVVIRPPLVYGPGVKGNFLRLLALVKKGLPIPLGDCNKPRSFIGLENMVDLLGKCIIDSRAPGHVFLVSDGEDIGTAELIGRLAKLLGKRERLVSIPSSWLKFGARIVGKSSLHEQLCQSLQVDISYTRKILDWTPSNSMDDELQRTAQWFLNRTQ